MALPDNLFLVRHGEIVDNATRAKMRVLREGAVVPGLSLMGGVPTDNGLTEFGIAQVASMRLWLENNTEVFSDQSYRVADRNERWMCCRDPLNIRTHETARYLSGDSSLWRETPYLNDRCWGSLGDRLTRGQLRQAQKDSLDPYNWEPEGGQSASTIVAQSRCFLNMIDRPHPLAWVVASCHGEVMIGISVAVRGIKPPDYNVLLREGYFDMPDAVIIQFSRSELAEERAGQSCYARERLICPWDLKLSRCGGRWEEIA